MLNAQIGLFKVTDGIYQVRGFDIANMTLIEGRSGWIAVDTLTAGVKDTLLSDDLKVGGSRTDLVRFFALLVKAPGTFQIVTK